MLKLKNDDCMLHVKYRWPHFLDIKKSPFYHLTLCLPPSAPQEVEDLSALLVEAAHVAFALFYIAQILRTAC